MPGLLSPFTGRSQGEDLPDSHRPREIACALVYTWQGHKNHLRFPPSLPLLPALGQLECPQSQSTAVILGSTLQARNLQCLSFPPAVQSHLMLPIAETRLASVAELQETLLLVSPQRHPCLTMRRQGPWVFFAAGADICLPHAFVPHQRRMSRSAPTRARGMLPRSR